MYTTIIIFNIISIFMIVLVNIIVNIVRQVKAKSNKISNNNNDVEIIANQNPVNQSTRQNTPNNKFEARQETGNHSMLSNNRIMEESKSEEFKRISENRNNALNLKRKR